MVCVILGLIFDINNVDQQRAANIVNNIGLSIVIVVVVINVVISAFDIKSMESRREIGELVNSTTIAPEWATTYCIWASDSFTHKTSSYL